MYDKTKNMGQKKIDLKINVKIQKFEILINFDPFIMTQNFYNIYIFFFQK